MTKLTLAQALIHPDRDFIALDDLDVSEVLIQQTVRVFQCLAGLDDSSPAAWLHAAECDVREDGALFLALNDPEGCADWFAEDDPSIYFLTEVSGSEAWAAQVRARCSRFALQ